MSYDEQCSVSQQREAFAYKQQSLFHMETLQFVVGTPTVLVITHSK